MSKLHPDIEHWIREELRQSQDYFPDDTSMRKGYQFALNELLVHENLKREEIDD